MRELAVGAMFASAHGFRHIYGSGEELVVGTCASPHGFRQKVCVPVRKLVVGAKFAYFEGDGFESS